MRYIFAALVCAGIILLTGFLSYEGVIPGFSKLGEMLGPTPWWKVFFARMFIALYFGAILGVWRAIAHKEKKSPDVDTSDVKNSGSQKKSFWFGVLTTGIIVLVVAFSGEFLGILRSNESPSVSQKTTAKSSELPRSIYPSATTKAESSDSYSGGLVCSDLPGEKKEQARSLSRQAQSLRPDKSPDGNWSKAAVLYKESARLYGEVSDKFNQANGLYWQGHCLRPDINKLGGDWALAAALYEKSAWLFEKINDTSWQASALSWQGHCLRPDINELGGDWEKAAALYEESARLRIIIGEKKGTTWNFYWAAYSMRPDVNKANGDWGKAATLFGEAARLAGEEGAAELREKRVDDMNYCLRKEKGGPETVDDILYELSKYAKPVP